MIEVYPGLFVGNQIDYERQVKGRDWCVVQACKEPYHRQAVGYKGLGGPRDHAEYLFCHRQDGDCRRLILNMIDAPKPEFFAEPMIDEALTFIGAGLGMSANVLVHCNQGASRAPSLALLYLRKRAGVFDDTAFEEAEDLFRGIYPQYQPAAGIRAYVQAHWGMNDRPS